jgi:hypothetical protein
MQILDGVLVSAHIKEQIKKEVIDFQAAGGKNRILRLYLWATTRQAKPM